MTSSGARVYIILVNWNGWRDTVECLESVFRLDYPDFRVIVCDNGSGDGSLERIQEWADGRLEAGVDKDSPLAHLVCPPVPKPVRIVEYDRESAEVGGDLDERDARLILVNIGANLGFAGGNNVGLRYAQSRGDFEYVWLLNNDTVVAPDSLRKMVERMSADPTAGMCGAKLLYYDMPDTVQALGARYSKWFGVSRHIGLHQAADAPVDGERIEREMDYVVGACILASKPFLRDVGLMSEDYFLYSEEIDWAARSLPRYTLAFAPESVVYHKEGKSLGSSSNPMKRSSVSDYYTVRNRLIIARRYYPWSIPTVYLGLIVTLLNRARRRQWDKAWMVLRIMLGMEPAAS